MPSGHGYRVEDDKRMKKSVHARRQADTGIDWRERTQGV